MLDSRVSARVPAWVHGCRAVAGPLVLAGFFLPWAHGPAMLSGTTFSGFTLLRFVGRMEALDLGAGLDSVRLLVRFLILGVAVTAFWLSVTWPRRERTLLFAASGWYVTAFAVLCFAAGAWRAGVGVPPPGLALLGLGSLAFVAGEAGERFGRSEASAPVIH